MKQIVAIIRPEKLEAIKDAFMQQGISGMNIRQILGCGNQKGWLAHNRGSNVVMNMIPKIEIKAVVPDEVVESMTQLILNTVRTGDIGDGKLFITPIEECIRIRTDEHGEDAL